MRKSFLSVGFALFLVSAIAGLASAQGNFTFTGSMTTARATFTATLLTDGRVLVAGGWVGPHSTNVTATAELYDPATGTWSNTGSMTTGRVFHTATLLPNGKVLVTGSLVGGSRFSKNSAELYDPATGTWTPTAPMNVARWLHTATLLTSGPNAGKVLVVGGCNYYYDVTPTAELYDPATETWSFTGSLTTARTAHVATRLPDGKVLVVSGAIISNADALTDSAEMYDPDTGTWLSAGRLAFARFFHTGTLLADGKVLVAGGGVPTHTSSAELYDPATRMWSITGSMTTPRSMHSATILASGKVLVTGGYPPVGNTALASAELYDPDTRTWSSTDNMQTARAFHSSILLADGTVLVAGGATNGGTVFYSSAELFRYLMAVAKGEPNPVSEGGTVTLDGCGSSGPSPLTYRWEKLAGTPVELTDPTSCQTMFTAPLLPGGFGSQTLTFQLNVISGSQSSTDTINITVVNVNHPPVPHPDPVSPVREGSPVTLSGEHSYDPDGDPLTYQWVQTGGTPVTLAGANTAQASFIAPLLPGGISGTATLGFRLTVSDGALSSTDEVSVLVEQENHPPLANAGDNQTRSEGSGVTLMGR